MSKSSQLYLAILVCFTAGFFGLHFFGGLVICYAWMALGIVLFIVRIARGDD